MNSSIIWACSPHDINLANQNRTSYHHRYSDYWKIDARKFNATYANIFPRQDIAPQKTCQRGTESRAKGAIVYSQCHAIDRGPECAITDWDVINTVNLLPGLNDARKKNRCANISTGKLFSRKCT